MNALRKVVYYASVCFAVVLFAGCGSPLVGLECRSGYEQCGRGCFDLGNDENHCGGCAIMCGANEQCVDSVCTVGSNPDGGADGGDRDGSIDGGADGGDGSLADGALGDGALGDAASDARSGDAASDLDGRAGDADLDARSGDAQSDGSNVGDGRAGDARTGDGSAPTEDGSASDGGGGTGADGGVQLPVLCSGPASPEDCVCDLGQIKCGDTCVDSNTDRSNCGGCDIMCEPEEYCAAGICAPICALPLTLCTPLCVNLQENDSYCGSCTTPCGVGATCIDGQCVGRAVGHIVLMGHDMSAARAPMQTMVGNSVFIARGTPLRVLAYDEFTNGASRAGVGAAIQTMAQTLSRTYTLTTAPAALVGSQLGNADTFVIEAQHFADIATLEALGQQWSAALATFLFRGGVILVLDAGGDNGGTHQILEAAGLLGTTVRTPIPRRRLRLETPSDAVAAGVPTEYQSEGESAGFSVDLIADPAIVVVRDPVSMLPVVLHKVVVN